MSDYPLSKVIVSASSAAVALAFDAGGPERQEDIWVGDLTEEEAKEFLALHGHENKEDFVDACIQLNSTTCWLIKVCLLRSSCVQVVFWGDFDQSSFQVASGLATWRRPVRI